ncbi:MAG TPA: efflux RND transporter periplasmic adaptor subunit [Pararhodobacter sp.]|uniref:efflux RND transporter periplasmic adaptor subunit n=1 Tax=Pararhodobacter sp. TaxID=2127056 RepID=UPI002BACFC77|nr:efflux RND transporter periplasmic adaptor subunit [Pararhodobacter sp.]HPD91264.1 efflux RND transporter periplasmic adaptor subunit [Pararhodobacter sp.]
MRLLTALPLRLAAVALFALGPCLPVLAQDQAPAVTVATAQERPLRRIVPVSGTLIARNEVLVYPHVAGFAITELNAEIGDRVEAGAVLARIDDRTLTLRVTQAEAALASAQAAMHQAESQVAATEAQLRQANQVLDRVQRLRESGAATQSSLDEAQAAQQGAEAGAQSAQDGAQAARAGLEQAQAARDVARLDLANAAITAPVAGIVSARNGQIGAIAASNGEPIFRLIEGGEVEVSAEVIETELVLLHDNDPATLVIAGLADRAGHLRRIAPVVNRTSRLGEVRIAIDDSEGLRPGLYVGGHIVTENRTGLAVPAGAVLRDGNGAHVLLLGADNALIRRAVDLGLTWDGWQEIIRGLNAGDEVVARAGAFFGEGDVVRPIRPDTADTQATGAATGATE